jgi:hypothetical protein
LTAQVHVSQRLDKDQTRLTGDFGLKLPVRLPAEIFSRHQSIQNVKPDIVAGSSVLAARISQANNEADRRQGFGHKKIAVSGETDSDFERSWSEL